MISATMWTLALTALLFGVAAPQSDLAIDPDVLVEVFGTPPPPAAVTDRTPLEQIEVTPTSPSMTYTDASGAACKCVPYYLCDRNNVTVDDPTITGFGELDIRFREDDCQESIERCCTDPVEPSERPPLAPDASRLKGCGYANHKGLDFTITGGTGKEAFFGELPWVVAVLAQNGSCQGAGALVHPAVVLTTAHTVYRFIQGGLKIRAGEWDTQTASERLPHQEMDVVEVFVHPEFHPKKLYNDIALLRLSGPVQLADHINTACLPPQDADFDQQTACVASGWGKDVFGKPGRYAVILKKVVLDMVRRGACEAQLRATRLGQRFRLSDTFVCAGGQRGRDTCEGDGGAPLVCPLGESRYQVAGMVAWGIGCGQQDVPGVYTRVSRYRNWVDRKMREWGYDTASYTAR